MATITFTGNTDWVVPDDNSSVTIRCYGGEGQGGSANGEDTDTSGGDDGGYAEGELNVTPGETLSMRFGGGGNGGFASEGPNSASGGDGGDSADVRQNGDTVNDIQILAGGGGGGGAAAHHEGGDGEAVSTGGGGGGGNGEDSNDVNGDRIVSTDGATGGGSSDWGGNGGSGSSRDRIGDPCGAGGGGGGGLNGGEGGNATATRLSSTSFTVAHGTGGGGGDGYTGGVSNSSQQTGVSPGGASVEIDYTPTPNPPQNVATDADHGAPSVEVTWDVNDSITDGFYVYRSTTQGFTPSSGDRIATINNSSTRSYTDNGVNQDQTYYYVVSAFEASSGNESDPSNESEIEIAETILVEENGNFVEKPVWVWDPNNSEWTSINGTFEYDEGTGTWDPVDP